MNEELHVAELRRSGLNRPPTEVEFMRLGGNWITMRG
jgi:hypothetical protein